MTHEDEVPVLFDNPDHQQWVVTQHLRLIALEDVLENHAALTKKIASDTEAMRAFMNDGAAAFRFFDRAWPAVRISTKAMLMLLGVLLFGYALTHDGHFPNWFVRAWEVVK